MRSRGPSAFTVGAVLLVVAVIVIYLGFTKDIPLLNEPYEIKAAFHDTSGINKRSPVRIAGVEVGYVTNVERTSPGARSATVTFAIRDSGRPINNDASAKIRPRIFLEGNFFVDLSPGTPGAGEMAQGATIPVTRTASPVQFDQVLSALKSDTRNDLRQVFTEVGAAQDAGGAKAFNDSLHFQPSAYKFVAIVSEALLGKRPHDISDLTRDGGAVAGALERDPAKLRSLIVDFDTVARALAGREAALTAAVGELPRTLRAASPALDALNAAFPDVRRFARQARPGVRSLGPTADATLPLVKQLRGLVRPQELGGLARQLHSATPALSRLATSASSVLSQLRALASCTTNVLVPFGNDKLVDEAFPTHGPVYEELAKFLPGLAGESRSFDANGPWFKVLATGGAETLNLGNGIFGSVVDTIAGNNPPPVRTRPPLRPGVPCETQEPPDLRSISRGPPPAINSTGAASRIRQSRAQAVAVSLLRHQLKAAGSDTKVLDRSITLDEIRQLAAKNGLTKQLNRALRKGRG
ncbi:MAG: phospholipid/cholesterol/gamma-HCH transport system substrate-binding protein [Solirubrobacteraceae bacterium]|jgi:virulence factor Mce-like protein|nr:phospholipid/cholesterol/gamma-HCH transport system substrate-binding protein [Solirubrobacteraceae bacterium]